MFVDTLEISGKFEGLSATCRSICRCVTLICVGLVLGVYVLWLGWSVLEEMRVGSVGCGDFGASWVGEEASEDDGMCS